MMAFLIVETPRGIGVGHRFLTSSKDLKETEAAEVVAAASQQAVGDSYVTVSRHVKQQLPSGTVREGLETIVLAGIDAGQLGSEKIEQIQAELSARFALLDSLIESVDWSQGSQSTVIFSKQLQQWFAEEVFSGLPTGKQLEVRSTRPAGMRSKSSKTWLVGSALLAVAFSILAIVYWQRFDGDQQTRRGNDRPKSQPASNHEHLGTLAREWGCEPVDVVQALKRAGNWNMRHHADFLTLDAGLEDGDVKETLLRVIAEEGSGRFWVSDSIRDSGNFKRFVDRQLGSQPSANEMKLLREWFYSTWKGYRLLKGKADAARDALNDFGNRDKISDVIVSPAGLGIDDDQWDSFEEPRTPLLTLQDLMIYRQLETCRIDVLEPAFAAADGSAAPVMSSSEDFATFVVQLRDRKEEVLKTIEGSRQKCVDLVRKNEGPESADKVFMAYLSLEAFIEQLSACPGKPQI